MKRIGLTLLYLAAIGCAGAQEEAPDDTVFKDERANPYKFNLSVAYSLLDSQQPQEAGKIARRLMDMDPDAAEPYYVLARAQLDMRQLDAAEKMLRETLRRDPKFAKAQSLYGTLLDVRGDAGAAARHRRAIALEPKNANFRNNLGFSLYLRRDYRAAIKAFEAALERDGSLRRVHNNLGFAYGRLGEMDKAAAEFAQAGPPAQVSNNLGVLQEERGDREGAYSYFLNAAQIDPLLVPARANLERVCAQLGRGMPELPDPKSMPARDHVEPVDAVYIEAERAGAPATAAASNTVAEEGKP